MLSEMRLTQERTGEGAGQGSRKGEYPSERSSSLHEGSGVSCAVQAGELARGSSSQRRPRRPRVQR